MIMTRLALAVSLFSVALRGEEFDDGLFRPIDVFQIEYASEPRISPDGKRIVYIRNFMDIMKDRRRSNLWIVDATGARHRPLTTGNRNDGAPRWSPDGRRLLYTSSPAADGSVQIYCRWMDTGQTAKLTNLTSSPGGLVWSPDGRWIAFSMFVPDSPEPFAELPPRPEGAEWAEPAKVIQKLRYRFDGQGYLKDGYHHLFVLSADGGTPRRITSGPYEHRDAPVWSRDSSALLFSSNRNPDWEYDPRNSEIYEVTVADRTVKTLTKRNGPDFHSVVSPDGESIAYLGFDDRLDGYEVTRLYVMSRDGKNSRDLLPNLDRDVRSPVWSDDGKGLFFLYDERGRTRIAFVAVDGTLETLSGYVGGATIGRPYSSGDFSVSRDGTVAYTDSRSDRPADVAVVRRGEPQHRLTALNDDLFGTKTLGTVEEIWFRSSVDDLLVQGWIVKPPHFKTDGKETYPLVLEIHGGPFANYGPRFAAELQLYATAGYVVLYVNPRGSTSYGKEFGNAIHHAYPGHDYADLMAGVDAVIELGYVDRERLFVTGGSGGGVLTSWIVGKTSRFRAAVAVKPVINWYSFCLTGLRIPKSPGG